MTRRSRYHDARLFGMSAIDAVRYAVDRRLSLHVQWNWMTGFEATIA